MGSRHDTVGHSAESIRRLAKRVGEAVAECNDGDGDDVEGHVKIKN